MRDHPSMVNVIKSSRETVSLQTEERITRRVHGGFWDQRTVGDFLGSESWREL